MTNSFKTRKLLVAFLSIFMCFALLSSTTYAASSRKLITKTITDSSMPWSGFVNNYSFKTSDFGVPYSLDNNSEFAILVDVEVSEPYDIRELQ